MEIYSYESKYHENYNSNYFPEEILIDILSRLPADWLVLFKRVCRRWRVLISSYNFLKLHIKRAKEEEAINDKPLVFVGCTSDSDSKSQSVWLRYGRSVEYYWPHLGIIWKQYDHIIYSNHMGSCDGLLMFRISSLPTPKILIVNPITQETRLITSPHAYGFFSSCIYFDRFEDDYKVLYVYPGHDAFGDYIYSFYKNEWRRINQVRTHFNFFPLMYDNPAIVGDALHWSGDPKVACSKRVLAFRIETKDFFFLPHPTAIKTDMYMDEDCCLPCNVLHIVHSKESMQVIEKNGQLCLCHKISPSAVIDIWILEDYGNWQSWVRKFQIDLLWVGTNYGGSRHINWLVKEILIVSSKGDDILFAWVSKGLYLYNMKTHKIECIIDELRGSLTFASFTKTLLSPNNAYTTL